jgi:hypothetical protein
MCSKDDDASSRYDPYNEQNAEQCESPLQSSIHRHYPPQTYKESSPFVSKELPI